MNTAVTVQNLTKRIGSFTAVDDISFDVPKGEIFGFLGSNGAGKTTTIRMLCGIITPTSGSAHILGRDILKERNSIKQSIGYMSQKFSLYDDLTVQENLEFFSGMYGINQDRKGRIAQSIEQTGLSERADLITGSLPFGIKQRLALASALMHKPDIVFLDEPTAGVDPKGRRKFWDIINALAEDGITIFVTTHYMDEAEYCNRIALLHKGSIKALGTPEQLKSEHMKGEMFEIRCSDPAAAMGLLRTADLGETALFANTIHINIMDVSDIGNIRTILAANSIAIESVEKVSPSLEDVFLNVLSEKDESQ